MDGRKNNTGKKGNKGGHGRPSMIDEDIRSLVINASWDILADMLGDDDVDIVEKRKVAIEIAKKTIPQNIKMETDFKVVCTDEQADKIINAYVDRKGKVSGSKKDIL